MKKKKSIPKQPDDRSVRYRWIWSTLLAAAVLLSIVLRWGLLDVPLERDEGEYAYGGQLLLQGVLPYQGLYSMKLPGIYVAYAGIMVLFGQTHAGIHLGLLVVNIATIIVLFLLGRRLFDPLAGAAAGAVFAVLSVGQSVQGVFANAEHFVVLPAIGGLLFLLRGLDEDRPWPLFWGGLLLGTGFIIKQHSAAFVVLGALYLIIDRLRVRPVEPGHVLSGCAFFGAGAVLPYALTCIIMALAGGFESFWFWTVECAGSYASQIPISKAWPLFTRSAWPIVVSAPLLWVLALGGLTALFWDERSRRRRVFIALFVLFSLVALSPGLYFRPHYFVLALPVAALLAGGAIGGMSRKLKNARKSAVRYGLPAALALVCVAVSIYQQRSFLFLMTPLQACRATYGSNPFPESLDIARYIRAHTEEGDRVAVIGSEPQIYFYTGRRSASGHVYMYPLMERHDFALQIQKEMIQQVESARPPVLVFVNIYASWMKRPDSHTLVFDWFRRYQDEHYAPVCLVSINRGGATYQWAPDLVWPPRTPYQVAVFRLKEYSGSALSGEGRSDDGIGQ